MTIYHILDILSRVLEDKDMVDYSSGQKRILAEFFSNLTVVWLAAAVITPILSGQKENIWLVLLAGVLLSLALLYIALLIAKEVK